jgi:hypothetical protein
LSDENLGEQGLGPHRDQIARTETLSNYLSWGEGFP